ncbi:AAA family ATPase [Streptomyces sp. NPDC001761]
MPEPADPAPDPSPAGPPDKAPVAGTLAHLIADRLAGSDLDEDTRSLLLTAFQDDDGARGRMPGAYLQSVTVSGFRGIGRTARLPLTPGPGLTLVTGRNGSGKSSFAEAVEIALTGDNARWRGRSDIWRKSWRNLHHGQEPQVAVELRIDGEPEPATVLRTWHGDDVADSTAELDRPGHEPVPLPGLGWQEDLATYRPFLSYAELGQVIGGRPARCTTPSPPSSGWSNSQPPTRGCGSWPASTRRPPRKPRRNCQPCSPSWTAPATPAPGPPTPH